MPERGNTGLTRDRFQLPMQEERLGISASHNPYCRRRQIKFPAQSSTRAAAQAKTRFLCEQGPCGDGHRLY